MMEKTDTEDPEKSSELIKTESMEDIMAKQAQYNKLNDLYGIIEKDKKQLVSEPLSNEEAMVQKLAAPSVEKIVAPSFDVSLPVLQERKEKLPAPLNEESMFRKNDTYKYVYSLPTVLQRQKEKTSASEPPSYEESVDIGNDAFGYSFSTKNVIVSAINETRQSVQQMQPVVSEMKTKVDIIASNQLQELTRFSQFQEQQTAMQRKIDDLTKVLEPRAISGWSVCDHLHTPTDLARTDADTHDSSCRKCRCKKKCFCSCHGLKEADVHNVWRGAKPKQFTEKRMTKESDMQADDFSSEDAFDANKDKKHAEWREHLGKDNLLSKIKDMNSSKRVRQKRTDMTEDRKVRFNRLEANTRYTQICASGGAPEDPTSSDSSDDDSNDDKPDKSRNPREATKRQTKWIIDNDAWKDCLTLQEDNFQKESRRILNEHMLPDGPLLNDVCSRIDIKPEMKLEICNAICDYIKQSHEMIIEVWAGNWFNAADQTLQDEVVFAIVTNGLSHIENVNYAIHCMDLRESTVRDENRVITEHERNVQPDNSKLKTLQQVQQKYAPMLMEKHKRVSRISVSWGKYTADGCSQFYVQECYCLALYVHIKGLIPIDENPIEKEIEGFPVDVREGSVILCKGPDSFHKRLKMGCSISGDIVPMEGTLGPFIRFGNGDPRQFALTSAHVLLPNNSVNENNQHCCVFQPSFNKEQASPFGKVCYSKYRKGSNGNAGMEFALIEVSNRNAISGNFPDAVNFTEIGFGPENPFTYDSGEVLPVSMLTESAVVFKYGCTTKLTQGKIRKSKAFLRGQQLLRDCNALNMYGQIEVEELDCLNQPFADYGDSGAVVLTYHKDKLVAVGLFEGKMKDGSCYFFTPLTDILNEIGRLARAHCYVENFSLYNSPSLIQAGNSSMDTNEDGSVKSAEIYGHLFDMKKNHTELVQKTTEVHENLERHKRQISEEIQQINQRFNLHTGEINQKLDQQTLTLGNLLRDLLSNKNQ